MLTNKDKIKLTNLIAESIIEFLNEKKSSKKDVVSKTKYDTVLKWLKNDQENNASVARELWPQMDDDTARSLFSKKVRGHDSNGKKYSFKAHEINKLYNMKEKFINKIS